MGTEAAWEISLHDSALDSAAEYRENNCRNEENNAEQSRVNPPAREFVFSGTVHRFFELTV